LRPRLVLGQLTAQAIALDEVGIAPQVHVLVERAELRRPAALELAVLVAADLAADLGVELEVLGLLAGEQRVRAQLVDHGCRSCSIGTALGACRLRSLFSAGAPPSRRRGGCAAGRDGLRRSPRTCRSTRAPSSWRRGRGRSASRTAWRRAPGACAA